MAKITTQIQDIDQALVYEQSSFTYLPKIAAPFTTVTNRASVTNFAADGLPKFGVDRRMTQQIMLVQGEQGPNGENVYKALNDFDDMARFVGGWTSSNSSDGPRIAAAANTDYMEVTFYGTGLNLLWCNVAAGLDLRVSTDGGAEGGNVAPTFGTSPLNNRNYCANTTFTVVSGLTLGMHTVKIRLNSAGTVNFNTSGFEVLNTSSSIFLPTAQSYNGGRRLYQATTGTAAYNSSFESGTLGTRGGHVLVYQKSDGTIAKAVQPTDSTALYLTSASHTNEEAVRVYHWREFGAGRTDDFSSVTTSSNDARAFTLDDGTTNLACSQTQASTANALLINANSQFWTLTFVGTGLDIVRQDTASGTDTYTLTVDGTSQGNLNTTGSTSQRIEKLCSGLPYGTHTVRVTISTAAAFQLGVVQFIVYAPKTPTLPSGAVALCDYFVVADYSLTSSSNEPFCSQGVIRKYSNREFVYSGTLSMNINLTTQPFPIGGWIALTSTAASYGEYTFFGTGAEIYLTASSGANYDFTVLMDGLALNTGSNSGSTTSLTISTTTTSAGTANNGLTLSAAGNVTGVLSNSSQPVIVRVTGLSLGRHTVRVTTNNTSSFGVSGVGIVTPIYAPRELSPARVQNVALVGSSGIRDQRVIAPQQLPVNYSKAWCQAVGVTSGPTTTSSTAYVPMPDMSTVIKTSGNPISISYSAIITNNTANGETAPVVYVNGVGIGITTFSATQTSTTTGQRLVSSNTYILPVSSGTHKIDLYWSVSAGTGTAVSVARTLTVREL